MTFATTRTWPSFVLQCLGICVTLLMLEQCVRLFCLSIVILVVQLDCCHFREHEHSPTTWDNRSINGFFLLCLMSSTFNPRLSQISLNMPTDNADNNDRVTIFLEVLKEDWNWQLNIFTLHSVTQADQAKKLLLAKDTYEYVQINIADITKWIKLGPSLHFKIWKLKSANFLMLVILIFGQVFRQSADGYVMSTQTVFHTLQSLNYILFD